MTALQVEQQHAGVLHRCLDLAQEGHCLSAVDQPVVVCQRHVHHGPHLDLKGRDKTAVSEPSPAACIMLSCELGQHLACFLSCPSDVSCLAGLPTQALVTTQAGPTPHNTQSLSGAVPYHKGYSCLLLPRSKQMTHFSHSWIGQGPLHTSGKYQCQQSCPTPIILCSSLTVKPFRS